MNRNWTRQAAALTVAVTLTAASCSSSSKSSSPSTSPAANSTSKGAATGSPISIGLVTSLTGLAAPNFIGAQQGVTARFDLQNSEGGIDGHPLKLATADDTSSVQGAATAVDELIQQKNVFSLISSPT